MSTNAMLMIQRIEGNNVTTVYYGPEFGSTVTPATKNSKASEAMKRAWQTRRARMAASATPKPTKPAKK